MALTVLLLAEAVQRVGLDEEALELRWENFQARPEAAHWQGLKAAADDLAK